MANVKVFHAPSIPIQVWSGATATGAGTEAMPGSNLKLGVSVMFVCT
jgi:hypothetical protein